MKKISAAGARLRRQRAQEQRQGYVERNTQMAKSADGRGRTVWEILTGRNIKDMTPLELQYHNPLGAKIGCTVSFSAIPEYHGIHFAIEAIHVYKTRIGQKDYFHTDYLLKGNALDWKKPKRLRLRLEPDEDANNKLGHKCQLLGLYYESAYDEALENMCNANGDHSDEWDAEGEVTFKSNYDDEGNEMPEPWRYWRVNDAIDPYKARVTMLADTDKDGTIEDAELETANVRYWDFSRMAHDGDQESLEFLTVEKDEASGEFRMHKGRSVHADNIVVV